MKFVLIDARNGRFREPEVFQKSLDAQKVMMRRLADASGVEFDKLFARPCKRYGRSDNGLSAWAQMSKRQYARMRVAYTGDWTESDGKKYAVLEQVDGKISLPKCYGNPRACRAAVAERMSDVTGLSKEDVQAQLPTDSKLLDPGVTAKDVGQNQDASWRVVRTKNWFEKAQ